MGFFKEFKDDFSDAVGELVPDANYEGDEEPVVARDDMVDTLDEEIDVDNELSKLDGLFEQVSKKVDNNETIAVTDTIEPEKEDTTEEVKEKKDNKESKTMETFQTYTPTDTTSNTVSTPVSSTNVASDENAVITKGMTITGNLESTGSINVEGTVNGDITCNGKLVIAGYVEGNSNSSEFFADSAKVVGEVNTTGTAKVGVGSVVIGNIVATSAVIAGAVKGDIDVQGPVVVDTSAVVVGNIKSRSVQINNGAVIEGFCSQTYADVDVEGLFG